DRAFGNDAHHGVSRIDHCPNDGERRRHRTRRDTAGKGDRPGKIRWRTSPPKYRPSDPYAVAFLLFLFGLSVFRCKMPLEMLRILQISSARTFGGGERHFADLSRALQERGHKVFAAVRPTNEWRRHIDFLPDEN